MPSTLRTGTSVRPRPEEPFREGLGPEGGRIDTEPFDSFHSLRVNAELVEAERSRMYQQLLKHQKRLWP